MMNEINKIKDKIINKICFDLDLSLFNIETQTFINPTLRIENNKFKIDEDDSKDGTRALQINISYDMKFMKCITKFLMFIKKDNVSLQWNYFIDFSRPSFLDLESIFNFLILYNTVSKQKKCALKNKNVNEVYRKIYKTFLLGFYDCYKQSINDNGKKNYKELRKHFTDFFVKERIKILDEI